MPAGDLQRPSLRLISGASEAPAEWSWFCGHCAASPAGDAAPLPSARVCRHCGLGLLLETPSAAMPRGRDAFLVVDSALRVQAVSNRAERLLGLNEESAVNSPVMEYLVSADAEAHGLNLGSAIAEAASGNDAPRSLFLRPWNTFGVRMRARIAPCGPPRAALIVLEAARDLHAVER